jgi:squalene-hopene/tetraprenyl-beta-curcumene cyclase
VSWCLSRCLLAFAVACACRGQATVALASAPDVIGPATSARDLALARLMEMREPSGHWADARIDLNAFLPGLFIVMLRTTGLVERPGALAREAQVVRHMVRQVNPDGGFFRFPGAASSPNITRLAILSLRMTLGEIDPAHRPARWMRSNDELGPALRAQVKTCVQAASGYLAGASIVTSVMELDDGVLVRLLTSYVNPAIYLVPIPVLAPEVQSLLVTRPFLNSIERRFHTIVRKTSPALSILYRAVKSRHPVSSKLLGLIQWFDVIEAWEQQSVRTLESEVRAGQNENGGWFYNAMSTMLNLMALREAGAAADDPAVERACGYLERCTAPAAGGGTFIIKFNTDVWDTALATFCYLSSPGRSARDSAIRPALEFLLRWQSEDGGYAFGSASRNDPDYDTTGMLVNVLALARRSADDAQRNAIAPVLRKAMDLLCRQQDSSGGFSAWANTFVGSRPGSMGLVKQLMVDVATPDITSRIAYGLCQAGLTRKDRTIRKALEFILANQTGAGAWWSRWWAGYLAGTGSVLEFLGKAGHRLDRPDAAVDESGSLSPSLHEAMLKGVVFLVAHQNTDGGWGETIEADRDAAMAGIGPSTPLHTAHCLSALIQCGYPVSRDAIRRGIGYLLATMRSDGTWQDDQVTFTIFAGHSYYAYPTYSRFLPLIALNDYLRVRNEHPGPGPGPGLLARPARGVRGPGDGVADVAAAGRSAGMSGRTHGSGGGRGAARTSSPWSADAGFRLARIKAGWRYAAIAGDRGTDRGAAVTWIERYTRALSEIVELERAREPFRDWAAAELADHFSANSEAMILYRAYVSELEQPCLPKKRIDKPLDSPDLDPLACSARESRLARLREEFIKAASGRSVGGTGASFRQHDDVSMAGLEQR